MAGPRPRPPASSIQVRSSKALAGSIHPSIHPSIARAVPPNSQARKKILLAHLGRRGKGGRRVWTGTTMPIWESHAAVHPESDPVEVPPPAPVQGDNAPPVVPLMTHGDQLVFRIWQAYFAAFGMALGLADDFASVTAFRYLVSAAALQCLWSLVMAIVDVYALRVGRSFRTLRALGIFSIGDCIIGALTFNAACASAGITVLIDKHPEFRPGNPCPSFVTTTVLAFLSWFLLAPCFVLNLAALVYKLQRP